MMMKAREHGGDLAAAEMKFGRRKDGWLDLSTGINPHAYPVGEISQAAFQRLPDTNALKTLERVAGNCEEIPIGGKVVAAAGSQALIQALPRLATPGRRVAILSPTYNEHAAAWKAAGHTVTEEDDLFGLEHAYDVIVAVNPNNPDGKIHSLSRLLVAGEIMATKGGFVVVDEAFIDTVPEDTIAVRGGTKGLVVLRSFGKFYGLAGVRVGFAIVERDLEQRLREVLGPWPVSGPAIEIATRALQDDAWADAMRETLQADSERLDTLLSKAGMSVVGGTTLFRLAESDDAQGIYEKLGKAGILVRAFENQPNWLRFGLPGTDEDWARLEEVFSS